MLRLHDRDPSALLEAAFARIERERMADVPILNPALRVQSIDFTRWQGHWLGALVTPWFLNLVLVPGRVEGWCHAADGERVFHRFGAGDFGFLGNHEPEVGEFQSCSLVSPMAGFDSQAAAEATARAALRMLHVERPAAERVGACSAATAGRAATGGSLSAAKPSRRALLFGRRAAVHDAP